MGKMQLQLVQAEQTFQRLVRDACGQHQLGRGVNLPHVEGDTLAPLPEGSQEEQREWWYASSKLVDELTVAALDEAELIITFESSHTSGQELRTVWRLTHATTGQSRRVETTLPIVERGAGATNAALGTLTQARRRILIELGRIVVLQPAGVPCRLAEPVKTGAANDLFDGAVASLKKVVPFRGSSPADEYEHLCPDVEDIGEESVDWVTAAARAWSLGEDDDIELDGEARVLGSVHSVEWSTIDDQELADATSLYKEMAKGAGDASASASRLGQLLRERSIRDYSSSHIVEASNGATAPVPTWESLKKKWQTYVNATAKCPENGPWVTTPAKRMFSGFIKAVLDLPKKPETPTLEQVARVSEALDRYTKEATP